MVAFSNLTYEERLRLLQYPTGIIDMVLDTDAYNEVDDQFAIAYAFLSPEKIDVKAVYAAPFYNSRSKGPKDGMEKSYDEILRILDYLGVQGNGLVYKGSERFMQNRGDAVKSAAADDLVNRAHSYSKENPLYVVAIGAITNVASAIVKDPSITDKIVVLWLGGHAHYMDKTDEFNMAGDKIAAQVVLDSGAALIQLPCNGVVSNLYTTTAQMREKLAGRSELGTYLAKIVEEYISSSDKDKKVIWDVAAIAWLINPDWAKTKLVACPIVTDELTYEFDRSRHTIGYVHEVDRQSIFEDLFEKISNNK